MTQLISPRFAARIRILLALVAVGGLTGCLSKPALHKQTFAFFEPINAATNVAGAGIHGQSVLGVKTLRIATPFGGRSMVYRTGEFTYERDPYAEFLESPAEELISPVREWFRQSGAFGAVVEPDSGLKANLLVEINFSQFYGDFRQPEHPEAVLVAQFIFFEATNGVPGKAIFEQEYSRRIPLSARTAAALMAGWNEALGEILTEVSRDLQHSGT
jgi:cholesterol transport system auxiliary component